MESIRKIENIVDLDNAAKLIIKVFMKFEAVEYSKEGIKTFKDFVNDKENMKSLNMYGYFENEELVGILALRENNKHISLFFVKEESQGKGVGKALFNYMISENEHEIITVHSSPYAVNIYTALGFKKVSKEQSQDGIRYTKMEYKKRI